MSAAPPDRATVEAVVIDCIRDTLGFEDEALGPELRLAQDLGAESMDFVDLVGRIGRRLGLRLDLGQLDDALREVMSAAEFDQGLVTAAALPVLHRFFPAAAPGEIYEGMALHEIPFLISVGSLIDFALAAEPAGP
jgi:acyl carrier protein